MGRLKPRTFISHGPGGWEVQDQGAGQFASWREPFSWFVDGCLLAVSSCGQETEGKQALAGLFVQGH